MHSTYAFDVAEEVVFVGGENEDIVDDHSASGVAGVGMEGVEQG